MAENPGGCQRSQHAPAATAPTPPFCSLDPHTRTLPNAPFEEPQAHGGLADGGEVGAVPWKRALSWGNVLPAPPPRPGCPF